MFLGSAAGLSLLCLARFWPHWSDPDHTSTDTPVSGDVPVK